MKKRLMFKEQRAGCSGQTRNPPWGIRMLRDDRPSFQTLVPKEKQTDVNMSPTDTRIPLGPFDHSPPRNYTVSVTYIPLKSEGDWSAAFKVLQAGLHQTFVNLPWLSGKVWPQSPNTPGWRRGQLEIRHEPIEGDGPRPSQFRYNELKTDLDYEDLKESQFPTDQFEDGELFTWPSMPDVTKGAPVLVSQANFLPGGCLLASAIFHAASDGVSLFTVSKLWADNCKAIQSQSAPVTLAHENSDRTLPGRIWAAEANKGDVGGPAARHLLGLPKVDDSLVQNGTRAGPSPSGTGPPVSCQQRKMLSAIFYIPGPKFAQLLKDCNPGDDASAARVSGNDAICALAWRCTLRARAGAARLASVPEADPSGPKLAARLDMILDGRLSFSPAVPASYLGNLTATVQPELALPALISAETPLFSVARCIREACRVVSQAALHDAYALLESWPDFDALQALKSQRRSGLHGHSLLVTSLLTMPLYDQVAFGGGVFSNGGKPDAARPLMGSFKRTARICFVMPRKSHGAVEFVVNLFEDEMELLLEDREFTKYAMFLS